jgi:quinol monooxygenase YgiN
MASDARGALLEMVRTSMSVLLVAEVHGRSGLEPQLRALLRELADASCTEPRCTGFRLLLAEEPAEFVLLGGWDTETAMRAHYDTSHYRHYRDQVQPLLARPSDVVVHHIDTTVHAVDPNPPDPGLFG